ncbi:MAG: hypothetical protein LBQ45_00745 [Mycoplasmataceae bacterium]|jgi:mediator of RNA polymerase II transcription subunit 25|nr:hypothetical protein [Mycoplasmataceae bacterium]
MNKANVKIEFEKFELKNDKTGSFVKISQKTTGDKKIDKPHLTLREIVLKLVDRFDVLEKDVKEIKTDVSTLKTDVSTLKTDVSTLKTDVSTLKTDVSTLKTDVSTLKTDVSGVKVVLKRNNLK